MTEEQKEELDAAMYHIKYSKDEVESTKAARYVLNGFMDSTGIRRIFNAYQTETLENISNAGLQTAATDKALDKVDNVLAQLFVNTYRMGMMDAKNNFDKQIEDMKRDDPTRKVIGTPHVESEQDS